MVNFQFLSYLASVTFDGVEHFLFLENLPTLAFCPVSHIHQWDFSPILHSVMHSEMAFHLPFFYPEVPPLLRDTLP